VKAYAERRLLARQEAQKAAIGEAASTLQGD
jgi:hypothetical protein